MRDVILNPKMPSQRIVKGVYCYDCSTEDCICYSIDHAYKQGGFHPWTRDNIRVFGRGFEQGYKETWKTHEWKQIPLIEMVADYYLLDGIASCVVVPGVAPPQTIVNAELMVEMLKAGFYVRERASDLKATAFKAAVAFAKLVTKNAPIVRDYMHYAMAGELSCSEDLYRSIGSYESYDACVSWHHMIKEFGYEKCARWAMEAFDECEWPGGYGGYAWESIAQVAHNYETGTWLGQRFGSREFLDRAFSLQHNNATVFDKTQWQDDPSDLEYVLNAHSESRWNILYNNASQTTRTLFNEHVEACNVTPKEVLHD